METCVHKPMPHGFKLEFKIGGGSQMNPTTSDIAYNELDSAARRLIDDACKQAHSNIEVQNVLAGEVAVFYQGIRIASQRASDIALVGVLPNVTGHRIEQYIDGLLYLSVFATSNETLAPTGRLLDIVLETALSLSLPFDVIWRDVESALNGTPVSLSARHEIKLTSHIAVRNIEAVCEESGKLIIRCQVTLSYEEWLDTYEFVEVCRDGELVVDRADDCNLAKFRPRLKFHQLELVADTLEEVINARRLEMSTEATAIYLDKNLRWLRDKSDFDGESKS